MRKINKHQYLALFYTAFGLLLYILSSRIDFMFTVAQEDVGPRFFPSCCAVGFAICGAGKFFASKDKTAKPFLNGKGWMRLALMVAILAIYIALMPYLGFPLCSFALMCGMVYMLSDGARPKWWAAVIFAAATTAAVWFAFTELMNVMLPQGKWIKALLKLF